MAKVRVNLNITMPLDEADAFDRVLERHQEQVRPGHLTKKALFDYLVAPELEENDFAAAAEYIKRAQNRLRRSLPDEAAENLVHVLNGVLTLKGAEGWPVGHVEVDEQTFKIMGEFKEFLDEHPGATPETAAVEIAEILERHSGQPDTNKNTNNKSVKEAPQHVGKSVGKKEKNGGG